jgi:hypothetical protein
LIATTLSFDKASTDHLSDAFLGMLPKIHSHARIFFRDVKCPSQKAEKVAETVALAWKWHRSLAERGKDATSFPVAFAFMVAKAVKSGRRVCGQEKARDVLSPVAQRRHGFKIEPLPSSTARSFEELLGDVRGQQKQDAFEERLQENTMTPVPDQVAFRIDFASWQETLTTRERRIIEAMARDERTKDLSRTFDVSPGRISQLRREFAQSWQRFCDDVTVDLGGQVELT